MANYNNCEACEEIRQKNPSLVVNGFTETECNYLKNDLGIDGKSTDCDDLDLLNDCLIGSMEDEAEIADMCSWREFIQKLIPNLWTVFSAIICAICGLWTRIHAIEEDLEEINSQVDRIDCIVGVIGSDQGNTFAIDQSNIRLGSGVSFRSDGAVPQFTGNAYCGYLTGAIHFNSSWTSQSNVNFGDGGKLVYEYRINKARHKIRKLWATNLEHTNSGRGVHAHLRVFNAGDRTYGNDGASDSTGSVVVPSGWIYAQVRMTSIEDWGNASNTGNITLAGVAPVLMDFDEIEC